MLDNKLIEISINTDFNLIDFSQSNLCLIFFHYDKEKTDKDYFFVKKVEEKYNHYVNWIDISDLFENYKKLHDKLKLLPQYKDNFDINQVILNYIKEYVYDEFLRTCKFYKD